MKKVTIVLFLSNVLMSLFSQDFLISNLNHNDLILGMSNPIYVIVRNVPCDSLILTMDNGLIELSEDGFDGYECKTSSYYAMPMRLGIATIKVNRIHNNDTMLVGERRFTVKAATNLVLTGYVGEKTGGQVNKNILANQYGITTNQGETNSPISLYSITEYSVIIIRDNNCIVNNDYKGNKFNEDLKNELLNLHQGDKVIFYGIQAIDTNKRKRSVHAIEFVINE